LEARVVKSNGCSSTVVLPFTCHELEMQHRLESELHLVDEREEVPAGIVRVRAILLTYSWVTHQCCYFLIGVNQCC
jgi:hypothetical protein